MRTPTKDSHDSFRIETLSIHGGERPDPVTKASSPNLVMSTTYIAEPDASFSVEGMTEDSPYFYTRWGNPTVRQLEEKIAILEKAEACVAFGSGMAAITALFLHVLGSGDELVISDVAYAAVAEMAQDLLPRLGIVVHRVDTSDLDSVARVINPKTKLIFVETPCNPILRLTDLKGISEIARKAGVPLAVDSTFATPIATQPISLGATYVLHSLTKYLCGHGDAIGGALLGPPAELAKLRQKIAIRTGGILSPFNAWLIMRGIATLPLRMKQHADSALALSQWLEAHPKVINVTYPGLPSHPQHDLAKSQMRNFSGMVTFEVEHGPRLAQIMAESLRVVHYAVSLGHQRSLIIYLPTEDLIESSFRISGPQLASYKRFAGRGIFRFSVGLENFEDLCEDIDRALGSL